MPEFLFKIVGKSPLPVFDCEADGTPRQPDGKTLFSLRQAARKCGRPAKELRELYNASVAELMPAEATAAVDLAPAEPGTKPIDPAAIEPAASVDHLSGDLRYINAARRVICARLDDEMFADFMAICRARNLDPLKRQIYPRTEWNQEEKRLEVIGETSIDGFAAIAGRDPRFDGIDGPHFRGRDDEWTEVWLDKELPPLFARAIVHIKGRSVPVTAIVSWDEFAPYEIVKGEIVYDEFWQKMPSHMLGKVARAHAYRRALPESLAGLYVTEELARMNREPKPAPPDVEGRQETWEFDDSLPQTPASLKLRLIEDFGLTPADADYRINRHRDRHRTMAQENEAQFCAMVYRTIRSAERRKGNLQLANA